VQTFIGSKISAFGDEVHAQEACRAIARKAALNPALSNILTYPSGWPSLLVFLWKAFKAKIAS
jgi:hypothetical protein